MWSRNKGILEGCKNSKAGGVLRMSLGYSYLSPGLKCAQSQVTHPPTHMHTKQSRRLADLN